MLVFWMLMAVTLDEELISQFSMIHGSPDEPDPDRTPGSVLKSVFEAIFIGEGLTG